MDGVTDRSRFFNFFVVFNFWVFCFPLTAVRRSRPLITRTKQVVGETLELNPRAEFTGVVALVVVRNS